MKIISKFKDNYDFMVSKYGLDETLVYDRRNSTLVAADELWKLSKIDKMDFEKKLGGYRFAGGKFINLNKTDINDVPRLLHSIIFIGKKLVHIFAADGKIYTSLDLKETDNKTGILTFNNDFRAYPVSQFWQTSDNATRKDILLGTKYRLDALCDKSPKNTVQNDTTINSEEILNAPIVLFKKTKTTDFVAINPQLSAMGLYLDTDFVWQSLVEFLSAKKDASAPTGAIPNDIKIAGKGFDVKRSFRPKMKQRS
ncbi:MAG: hypothetical protein ACFN38_05325 [Campylobacter sp.]